MSLALRRLRRLLGTGSPRTVARAARRAVSLRRATGELDAALASDRSLVVGPFLGEVGYELLYWRPYVLRLLRSHGVDPERVTVIGRGGSGAWYGDVAVRSVDAFELLPPAEVLARIEERVARTGQRKQLEPDALDRDLQRLAAADAAPVHPLHMFWGSRFAWEGLVPPAEAVAAADHEPLARGELPPAVAERLPERYTVLKAYFNECVPETPETRAGYARLTAALAEAGPVVALDPGFAADEHEDWAAEGVVRVSDLLEPATNLAVQAAIVARADALVATYGGFAYLGPYLGVPTTALGEVGEENPHHEHVLRAALPGASYRRASLAEAVSDVAAADPRPHV
jgi:hypothetical protein